MNFQNTLLKVMVVFLILTNSLFASYNDKKVIHDNSGVSYLEKTAVIRFAKPFGQINSVNSFAATQGFTIEERLLKKAINMNNNSITDADKYYSAAEKLGRTYIITYNENISPEKFCTNLLENNPIIEIAEPYRVPKFQEYFPDDPGIFSQVVLDIIDAFSAWDLVKGDENIVIGISDSGCDQEHEDIKDNIYTFSGEIPGDSIDNDENGYIDDYNGYNFNWEADEVAPNNTYPSYDHGMRVAGIASATPNNKVGITGSGLLTKCFPMKITDNNDNLIYAYQSIMYAADNGFKVLNLSWGNPGAPSDYEQSVIDYAVSMNVAIVASAGNKEGGLTNYATYYPAAYFGVLGVGESDYNDTFSHENSMVGVSCDIMAMGEGNKTLSPGDKYKNAGPGTSFSAPVVSGVVAIARAAHPELDAIQILELVRQTGDTVLSKNFYDLELIPKRANMYKAVITDPMSIPAINPYDYIYKNTNNEPRNRFLVGDTVLLTIKVKNYLKTAEHTNFKLSIAYDFGPTVKVISDSVYYNKIESDESVELSGFKFVILDKNEDEIIFRLDISDDTGYTDFKKFGFIPTSSYNTFSNNKFKFSLSDDGFFGFYKKNNNEEYGAGFELSGYGNQIFSNSGLIACQSIDKGLNFYDHDFMNIKPFGGDEPNIGIVNDGYAPSSRRIGIDIIQDVQFEKYDDDYFAIYLGLKNSSTKNIVDPAVGYFIDWDITEDVETNHSELFPEAIPEELSGFYTAAQLMRSNNDDYPIFGMAVTSSEDNAIAQSAGLYWDQFEVLGDQFSMDYLNAGTTVQAEGPKDIGVVMGMKYAGTLLPNQIKECKVCFSSGDTREELAANLKKCLLSDVSVHYSPEKNFSVYPQPADNEIFLSANLLNEGTTKIRIFDVFGNDIITTKEFYAVKGDMNLRIDITELNTGRYFISVKNGTNVNVIPITVVK